MTIVHRALRGRTETQTLEVRMDQSQLALEGLRSLRMGGWSSVPVTPESALKVPAVSACVQFIAGSISSLNLCGYREVVADNGEEVEQELRRAQFPRLWREPSAELPLEDWVYRTVQAMMLDGCAWGRIVQRDARLSPTQVELVPAEAVQVRVDRGSGMYEFRFDGEPVDPADVWRVTGRPARVHPFGMSLVDKMSDVVGMQLAARQYGAQWFSDGAHPTAVITSDVNPGQQGAQALKDRLMSLVRGSREPLVLPSGTKLEPYQSDPKSSSLLEILTQSTNDIAQFFLMPPELVGGTTGDSMTYATTEAQSLRVLQFALRYWMRKLELAMSRAVRPQAIYAKFDENDFVRTDLKTKVEAAVLASGGPIWTPNEARYADDRPPLDGGDVLRGMDDTRRLSVAEAVQKVYLGVGSVLTPDEAREIVNEAGGSLPVPGPDGLAPKGQTNGVAP